MRAIVVLKGGPGSGFYGHKGRPGKVGGSAAEESASDASVVNIIDEFAKKISSNFGIEVPIHYVDKLDEGIFGGNAVGRYDQMSREIFLLRQDLSSGENFEFGGAIDFGGAYSIKNASTAVYGTKAVIVHELAHAFDFGEHFTGNSIYSDSEEFENIYKKFYSKLGKINVTFAETATAVSRYSLVNNREFFAESMVAYVFNPEWLRSVQPDTYNYFSKLPLNKFKNKEHLALEDTSEIAYSDGTYKWIRNSYKSTTIVLKQLPISEKDVQKLLDLRVNIFYDKSDKLAERVFTGDLTIGAWEEAMRAELRQLHSSAAAIAKGGWDNMTSADWGRLGTPLREQYKYLHGFANTIAEQSDTISLKAIQARARMYGRATGNTTAIIQAGSIIESLLPWLPGDGSTRCLVNCKCRWDLRIIKIDKKSGDKTVKAVWRLSPAEHCEDCLERNGHVETIVVPKTVVIPKYIGLGA